MRREKNMQANVRNLSVFWFIILYNNILKMEIEDKTVLYIADELK